MDLRGEQYIGSQLSQKGERTFQATDAETGEVLEGLFYEATLDEADQAGKADSRRHRGLLPHAPQTPDPRGHAARGDRPLGDP